MSKLALDSVRWEEYKLNTLFEFKLSKGDNQASLLEEGNIPLISSGLNTNGITKFIKNGDGKALIFGEKTITIDMFGKAFYHDYSYFSVSHGRVNILIPKFTINKYIAAFLITVIDNSFSNIFSYNRMCSQDRLNSTKILLPTTLEGMPNWQFMEDYIKQEISLQSQSLSSYYEDKLIRLASDLLNAKEQHNDSPCFDSFKNINSEIILYKSDKDCVSNFYKENLFNEIYTIAKNWKEKYSLKNTAWKEFFIEDVCEINSGKDIYERERIDGNTPYVTATASNNGIGYFISNKNTTYQRNCISVNRNGSVGYSFYHEYGALFGNDTRKLTPKIKDPYIAKFISFMISEQKDKYGYGYKMGTGRLKRQKILLPVQEDDTIDYNFMRKYMITRKVEIIQNILKRYSNYTLNT